jgi:hypothetical protein
MFEMDGGYRLGMPVLEFSDELAAVVILVLYNQCCLSFSTIQHEIEGYQYIV